METYYVDDSSEYESSEDEALHNDDEEDLDLEDFLAMQKNVAISPGDEEVAQNTFPKENGSNKRSSDAYAKKRTFVSMEKLGDHFKIWFSKILHWNSFCWGPITVRRDSQGRKQTEKCPLKNIFSLFLSFSRRTILWELFLDFLLPFCKNFSEQLLLIKIANIPRIWYSS